ncbi:putative nucleotidyltransferase [Candidatus Methanophagaceae archaeon]|nr:putative nucleotidyltransferase [Methanophagales archaeon]
MQSYYEVNRELHDEWGEKFKAFIESLKGKELCVILFCSKAKGEDNLLSDFDLLIITKDKESRVLDIEFPADLFCYTLEDCLKGIKNRNTILLDAFTQGKAIFDNIDVFDFLKNEVKYAVERSGLIRCVDDWLVQAVV